MSDPNRVGAAGPNPIVQRWLGGGLKSVMLPTQTIFAFRIPDVEDLVAKGLIPEDLRKIALTFAASSVDPATMDTDGLTHLLRFMRTLIAQSLRYVWDGEIEPIEAWRTVDPGAKEWQVVSLTAGELAEAAIDADDYAALHGIVSRQFHADAVTAQSLAEGGFLKRAEADQIISEAKTKTVPGWSSFRGERRGAAAGDEREPMAQPPVRAGRRKRSGSSTRAR